MGSVTQLATVTLPALTGYVEAATADRILGWAWGPREPSSRATVELHLADEIVATAIADQPRADLASSGIGDGNHAFELIIPPALQGRAAELLVWARVGSADPVAIGAPPAAEALAGQVARMLRGLDAVMGAQRALHRAMQSVVVDQQDGSVLTKIAAAQEAMAEQLAMVERFVVRLDERLLVLTPAVRTAGRAVPPATVAALVLASLAFVVGVTGLVRSLAF